MNFIEAQADRRETSRRSAFTLYRSISASGHHKPDMTERSDIDYSDLFRFAATRFVASIFVASIRCNSLQVRCDCEFVIDASDDLLYTNTIWLFAMII